MSSLTATVGARQDDNEQFGHFTTGRIGLSWRPLASTRMPKPRRASFPFVMSDLGTARLVGAAVIACLAFAAAFVVARRAPALLAPLILLLFLPTTAAVERKPVLDAQHAFNVAKSYASRQLARAQANLAQAKSIPVLKVDDAASAISGLATQYGAAATTTDYQTAGDGLRAQADLLWQLLSVRQNGYDLLGLAQAHLARVQALIKKNDFPSLRELLEAGPKQFVVAHQSDQQASDRFYLASWALAFHLAFELAVPFDPGTDDGAGLKQRFDRLYLKRRPPLGELLGRVGGRSAMEYDGYTDRAATERKLVRDAFEPGDAWFRTGDLLRRDADGYYYFVDRIGDTFRWKGENVATQEVADALNGAPGVSEANVYGVEVPGAEGRAGMAAVVLADGARFDGGSFYAHAASHLPAYAHPAFVRLVPEMDVTGTLKQRKQTLAAEAYDLGRVRDPLYVRDDAGSTYRPLTPAVLEEIRTGQRRL